MRTTKKYVSIFLLGLGTTVSQALPVHSTKSVTDNWISKGIARYLSKEQTMTHFSAQVVSPPNGYASKEVQRIGKEAHISQDSNIVSSGLPEWAMTKPVNKLSH